MFAGDQDRERAAATLQEHYVRGRLTLDELSYRTGRVFSARSRADIRTALAGLPLLPGAFGFSDQGRGLARVAARGAMLFFFTALYVVFNLLLLLVFAATVLIHGASGTALVGFLLVWLIPTYLLSRLWRRKAT
jgi:Domain of unknown function (DUF1707)